MINDDLERKAKEKQQRGTLSKPLWEKENTQRKYTTSLTESRDTKAKRK
jgi:hypothetical protein